MGTTDVTGAISLPEGKEMVMPGDNVKISVKLINPIAMEEGLRFAMREGGKTVGAGVVPRSSPDPGSQRGRFSNEAACEWGWVRSMKAGAK